MPDKPRDDQSEAEERQERQIPPIPDGGLSSSMPEWLRRPPAWKTLPEPDKPEPAKVDVAVLPDPDTSVIDPHTLIDDDDLPVWLRSLRKPEPGSATPGDATIAASEGSEAVSPSVPGEAAVPSGTQDADSEPMVFRPRRPPVAGSSSTTTSVRGTDRAGPPRFAPPRPRWEQRATILALGVALVIALIVILILVIA